MNTHKTFRHGQILRLVSDRRIANQKSCAAGWPRKNSASTQATLSRDLQELRLIKTQEGYKPAAALPEESAPLPSLARALGEFLLDIRPAENLLVLKTPPAARSLWRPPWMAPSSLKSREPSPVTTPF